MLVYWKEETASQKKPKAEFYVDSLFWVNNEKSEQYKNRSIGKIWNIS